VHLVQLVVVIAVLSEQHPADSLSICNLEENLLDSDIDSEKSVITY
jgi:hypothetical protein